MRSDAQNSILQIVLLLLVMLACVFIFGKNAGRLSNELAAPVKALAKDMELVSHMHFQPINTEVTSSLYEISKINQSFSLMKATLQVSAG